MTEIITSLPLGPVVTDTPIDTWPEKLQKLRDYVAAKASPQCCKLERSSSPNLPWTVTVTIDVSSWKFTLVTSEILELRNMLDSGELSVPELFA